MSNFAENLTEEATEIFRALSPENQINLLVYLRVAYVAECSAKKSLERLQDKDKPDGDM
jgi:hypothetical protein